GDSAGRVGAAGRFRRVPGVGLGCPSVTRTTDCRVLTLVETEQETVVAACADPGGRFAGPAGTARPGPDAGRTGNPPPGANGLPRIRPARVIRVRPISAPGGSRHPARHAPAVGSGGGDRESADLGGSAEA